jgi:hypothetical protein
LFSPHVSDNVDYLYSLPLTKDGKVEEHDPDLNPDLLAEKRVCQVNERSKEASKIDKLWNADLAATTLTTLLENSDEHVPAGNYSVP